MAEASSADDAQLWRATDCARETGIPVTTWRYWANTGRGPASFKLSRQVRVWRKSTVMAWIAEQERSAEQNGAA